MSDPAIKLFGTLEPAPKQHRLSAGATTATFEDGQLRWIRIGEAEAIRAIAFLVRDRNWSTCVPEISNLAVDQRRDGFSVTFDALCRTPDGSFRWHGDFRGEPDGSLRLTGSGGSDQDFVTCRTGFVILHPLEGVIGRAVTIEHTDGSIETADMPEAIVPDQPFRLLRSMTHEPMVGVRATIRMEGDAWETEDHRNWTDASLKTYSRPLSLPWPYVIRQGKQVLHTVTLTFSGNLPTQPAQEGRLVSVRLGNRAGVMPALGLSVLPEDAERAASVAAIVRAAGPQHLNVRLDLRQEGWRRALGAYRQLAADSGSELVLEIIIPGQAAPASELAPLAAAVSDVGVSPAAVLVTPAADLASYPPGTPPPAGVPSWREIAAAARAAFPGARLGGGMLSNFTELNRKRPPAGLFDFIAHATSSLVHAADDRSVMEAIESIGHIITSTRSLIGDTPYRIGPSHIGNSFNPYGSMVTDNPENRRVTMARADPRHRGLFGAAWHLGFLSQAAEGGVEAATMASPAGEFGIAYTPLPHPQPEYDGVPGVKVYPLFHIIKALAGAAGATRLEATSSDSGRLRALAWQGDGGPELWIANLCADDLDVAIEGFGSDEVDAWMLDADSFDAAIRDQDLPVRPFSTTAPLHLAPFAVARLRGRP